VDFVQSAARSEDCGFSNDAWSQQGRWRNAENGLDLLGFHRDLRWVVGGEGDSKWSGIDVLFELRHAHFGAAAASNGRLHDSSLSLAIFHSDFGTASSWRSYDESWTELAAIGARRLERGMRVISVG